jgi:hypothetical protein
VPNDLWIADRNFCTTGLLTGVPSRSTTVEHEGLVPRLMGELPEDGTGASAGQCGMGQRLVV